MPLSLVIHHCYNRVVYILSALHSQLSIGSTALYLRPCTQAGTTVGAGLGALALTRGYRLAPPCRG